MIGTIVAHYQIEEKLGGGGMGVVYRARDTKLDRDVALKFLPPSMSHDAEAKARFVQEAKAASGLDHPNVCTIYEIGEADDGRLYIAMGFYDGKTLKYALEAGPRSVEEVASIGLQIAEGLGAAHAAGIVHRDIKPANVMLQHDGRVKILDFGVAKLGSGVDLTKAGSTVGTTAYMSPEQARGEEVDGRTDIWSTGVILYQLLTGKRPFDGDYEQAVVYGILNQEPESPGGELADLVLKMLAKDPDDRYADAAEVATVLGPFAPHTRPVHAAAGAATQTPAKPATPRWAIPVVAILLAGMLWFVFERGGEGPASGGVEPNRILIMPFLIQGPADMEPLSDGMVTLLSTMLDGAGFITTVDQASVIESIQRRGDVVLGPSLGVDMAREFNAGRFVVGSIVRAGSESRMNAGLYRLDGTREAEADAVYAGDDDFIRAVDELAAELVGGRLADPAEELSSLAVGTTASFEALKHYLESDRLLRAGEFAHARDEIDRALAIDSTFAVAWYLKAEIMGWLGNPRAVLAPARKAAQYSGGLSGRTALLIEADLAFNEGRRADSERMLRAILRDYPESKEATGSLAEILEHYDSRVSAKREALSLFARVTELSPGNQQYAMHHGDLLALTGLLDGDYHGLDSLAALYAGMPIPERGDSLDWSTALDLMSPDARRYMIQHARLRGSAEDSLASFDIDPALGFAGGRFVGSLHFEHALASHQRIRQESSDLAAPSASGLAWWANLSSGRWAEAKAIQGSGSIEFTILSVTLPTHEVPRDSLQILRRRLDARSPSDIDSTSGVFFKQYLGTLLAWRMDDAELLQQDEAAFRLLLPDTSSSPIVASMALELQGLLAWQSGDLIRAEAIMESALQDNVYFLDFVSFAGRPQPGWFLAEIREDLGDLEGAIDYFNTIAGPFVVPGWERTAALYERLGNTDEAIRYYGLVTKIWANADAELQPRVEAARSRMEALVTAKTREGR